MSEAATPDPSSSRRAITPPEGHLDPAIALVEFSSIAAGIEAGDAMVKASPLGSIYAGTAHPGKYLVMVSGDTASVSEALEVGREIGADVLTDSMFLPNVHPAVTSAIVGGDEAAALGGDALGIIETATVATVLDAADAGVKAAEVSLAAVRLADGLGGKGYALFSGVVAQVEAAMAAAVARAEPSGSVLHHRIIAQLHDELANNLDRDLRFMARVSARPSDRGP